MVQDISRLRRAERYLAEFVGNVSHELRTPATAIYGYAETLLEERASLDPLHAEMVEVIHRNARRLTALFDDLLTLSRLDARVGPLPLSTFRLASVVAEAFDKCSTLARDKRIHFESLVPPYLEVLANRDAMGHVVGNLVENAVKYSYEGGVVTVRAQPRDRYVLLEVIDLGIGIDPAHHQRIFERFYRVDKGRARSAGGTGLGLSIVKHLVEAMGAAIDLKSKPGSGSVFRVLLRAPVEEDREPGGG
jgi:two-component system phosphate regulon sensor histidine kinase PhoR